MNNKKLKIFIKFIVGSVLAFPIVMILGTVAEGNLSNLEDLKKPNSWLCAFIFYLICMLILSYFSIINPRKYIYIDTNHIKHVVIKAVIASLLIIGLLPMGFLLAENGLLLLIVFISCLLIVITIFYSFSKGIRIYQNKHILVYNQKLKYYKNASIEEIMIVDEGKKSKLIVKINEIEHLFLVSTKNVNSYRDKILKAKEKLN